MSNPIERLTNSVIGGDSKKAALIVSETNLYYLTAFPSTAVPRPRNAFP